MRSKEDRRALHITPQRNNMSFLSALQGTQINQRYRQNARQLQNIDRDMRDDRFAFNDQENKRGNAIEAFGSFSKGLGTLGGELKDWDKNVQFGKKHGLEANKFAGKDFKGSSLLNMVNPFKKGGFGQTYSNDGGPNMTVDDLGKTRRTMDWSKAFMGPDAFSFGDASEMMMSDNPMQTLLGRWNQWKSKDVKDKMSDSLPEHKISSMDGRAGYEKYLEDERLRKEKEDYELNNLGEIR